MEKLQQVAPGIHLVTIAEDAMDVEQILRISFPLFGKSPSPEDISKAFSILAGDMPRTLEQARDLVGQQSKSDDPSPEPLSRQAYYQKARKSFEKIEEIKKKLPVEDLTNFMEALGEAFRIGSLITHANFREKNLPLIDASKRARAGSKKGSDARSAKFKKRNTKIVEKMNAYLESEKLAGIDTSRMVSKAAQFVSKSMHPKLSADAIRQIYRRHKDSFG